jgi:ABC-type transport system involved in cytochrome c biogenesis ATPase subunit
MGKLKDILQQQRKKNFVGRQKELNFFQSLLNEAEPSIHLLYIYGPGGQGKTTLLKQFADLCRESARILSSLQKIQWIRRVKAETVTFVSDNL